MFSSRRRRVAWVAGGLLIWVLAVALTLLDARRELEAARAAVETIRIEADRDKPDADALIDEVRQVDRHLQAADRRAESFVLRPLRPLPIIGRQLDSIRSMVGSSAQVSGEAVGILDQVDAVADGEGDLDRLQLLTELDQRSQRLLRALQTRDLGPDDHLVQALADGRRELEEALGDAETGAETLATIVSGLRLMADDGDFLLLGANNAEMRLGAGMVLSVGELNVRAGEVSLPGLFPSEQLFPVPESPAVDADVLDRWGFLTLTNDYRKLTYSARFDEFTGPQALAMWEQQTGRRLDGVVLVDPFVLDAVLAAIGPVDIEGRTVAAGGVVGYLLQEQYAEFSADKGERRDALSLLSAEAFAQMGERSWSPLDLLRELLPLVRGRHLMAFSPDPAQQQVWRSLGADGHLDGAESGVFLLNIGASKLDPFIDIEVEVGTEPNPAGGWRVRYEITITNAITSPDDLPDYVLGPWEPLGLRGPGTYSGRLALYAPGSTSRLEFAPPQPLDLFGPDGPVVVMAARVDIDPGQQFTTTVEFDMTADELDIVPSARFPAVEWRYGDFVTTDAEPFVLGLS